MARLREVSVESATAEQAVALAEDISSYGHVLNTTKIYAHVPELLKPLRELHNALAHRQLSNGLVSLARLRVAQIVGCPF